MNKMSIVYIPVIIQYACFRVLERFQFKATLCNKGYSIIKINNAEDSPFSPCPKGAKQENQSRVASLDKG
jgi:hypothetical protein